MSEINYQALREAAEQAMHDDWGFDADLFHELVTPSIVLALLDERERNQQYIKSRDQENEDIALTVGKLRVEREAAKKRIAELEAEPVSQTYKLPSLPSSEVNDAAWKLHNMLTEHGPLNGRQFSNLKGCFYEALKVAMRNYPVTPDAWISCSARMPAQDDWILIYSKHGEYMAGQVQGEYVELSDGTLSWLGNALFWTPLPEPPQEVNRG
ncbi:TPA: ead/Ea22-like family protein [Escherichia coli]|nr:ead/Ea22-like family protein [Escherichia coli]HCK2762449.1 ead/Ea22-like family protein [Escherichia coli]